MIKEPEYKTGKYTDGFGPGKGGLWYVERTVTTRVALAESSGEALRIVQAFKDADKVRL